MDIVSLYLSSYMIEGIKIEDLENILTNNDNDIGIKSKSSGIIILSNNKIIKCVRFYYNNLDDNKKTYSADCFYVQKRLNVQAGNYNCTNCHLMCLRKFKNKELKRLIK